LNLSMVSALAVSVLTGIPAAGQAKLPRTPDGKPNLNGIWQAMNTADWDLQAHAAQQGLVLEYGAEGAEPGGLGVVEGGEIPYLPAALAKKKENYANRLKADPEVKCYLPGVPRATYLPYPFQIFQSEKYMAIAYEYDSAFRNIYLKDPGPAPNDSWMGQSFGHWEGDTLVVDVTGLDERSWLDRAGDFHSDALHVVERYTLVNPDIINYEATIEDSKVFSRSWKISMPLYKHVEKNAQLLEFKCVEFVEDLLYGQFEKKTGK
ncbi:MAG: hypothetical protein ABSB86_09685, partial [Bryobacteraceae bacterium]